MVRADLHNFIKETGADEVDDYLSNLRARSTPALL